MKRIINYDKFKNIWHYEQRWSRERLYRNYKDGCIAVVQW